MPKKDTRGDKLDNHHYLTIEGIKTCKAQGIPDPSSGELAKVMGLSPLKIGTYLRKLARLGYVNASWKIGREGGTHAYTLTAAGRRLNLMEASAPAPQDEIKAEAADG